MCQTLNQHQSAGPTAAVLRPGSGVFVPLMGISATEETGAVATRHKMDLTVMSRDGSGEAGEVEKGVLKAKSRSKLPQGSVSGLRRWGPETSIMLQWVESPPAMPVSHMGTGSNPTATTPTPAPCK